jgi:hypothetical protein
VSQRGFREPARATANVEYPKIGGLDGIENHTVRWPEEQWLKRVPVVAPAPSVELLAGVGGGVVHPEFLILCVAMNQAVSGANAGSMPFPLGTLYHVPARGGKWHWAMGLSSRTHFGLADD